MDGEFFPTTTGAHDVRAGAMWKGGGRMAGRKRVGRPPKFKSVEAMERLIEAYFEGCRGEVLRDADDEPVLNKFGEVVMVGARPPTMTGLALALGCKPQFEAVIRRAKSRIEQYTEERLFDRDGNRGAQFSLQNNFRGWKESRDVTLSAAEGADIMAEVRTRMAAEGQVVTDDA